MIRVNAITFLNNFVSGALTLLIPLLLLAQNVNLADIGLVLSVLPLVFLAARLLLAAVADQIGWISIAVMFNSLATYPLITLLLPVFMDQQMGYSYATIGLLFMLYNVTASATAFLTLKAQLSLRRAVIQSVIAVLASIFLASSGLFFPALLFALAFVRGFSIAFFKYGLLDTF